MTEAKSKMGVIQKILKENFQRAPSSSDFSKCISSEHLRLTVTDRIDKNYLYVTDGVHTIMTINQSRRELNAFTYNAFQRAENDKYVYAPKSFAWATFNTITEAPAGLEKHPYSPHHYLKQRYNAFVKDREEYRIKCPAQRLVILEWNLQLVNISCTGYYAPVIVVRKSKIEAEHNPPDYTALNCVLYEKWLQEKMEVYRINDIRSKKQQQFPVTQNICMFYFMRNMKKVNSMEKTTSMATVDKEQLLLKHDSKRATSYVIIGNLSGPISFPNMLKNEINESKIQEMNLRNLASLFNGISLIDLATKSQPSKVKEAIWSSESESSSDGEASEKNAVVNGRSEMELSEEDEEEGEQDPLKNLYLKELQSRRMKAE